jgi:hypothetical protein
LDSLEETLNDRLAEVAARLDELKSDLATVINHVRADR